MARSPAFFSRLMILVCLLGSGVLRAQIATVGNVTVASRPQGIALEIELSAAAVPQTQQLANPDRLVFDFPGFVLRGPTKHMAVNSAGINDVRVALNSAAPPLTRIVVDSRQPLNFELKPSGNRLVIEISSSPINPAAAATSQPSAPVEKEAAARNDPPKNLPSAPVPAKAVPSRAISHPSPSNLSAYMLQAKARDLKLDELQPLEDKAQTGNPEAETTLALAFHAGTLLKKDDAEAERWLRKAADQNFMAAEESLGIFAETGVGRTAPAPAEAIDWYKKAIQLGSVVAATSIGLMYAEGIGMPKDPAQAAIWFRQAAEGGDGVAQYNLAILYRRGSGVPQDLKEYLRWLTPAAEQDIVPALLDLAGYYARPPDGSAADMGHAVHFFERAGELGSARAQAILGNIFALGRQGKPDYEQAVKWYRMAADQGQPDGEFGLGVRYAFGQGVPLDLQEARRLFTAAADQGQINAQYDLGTIYEEGNGVPADRSLATHYFQLAAEQGMSKAQFRVGRLLASSKESSNRISAYKWLMLAQESVKESSPILNDLRKSMSPQEIAEADQAVDRWRIAHR
jgi:TPR repeat protein